MARTAASSAPTRQTGFTLIELLITLLIVGLIYSILPPKRLESNIEDNDAYLNAVNSLTQAVNIAHYYEYGLHLIWEKSEWSIHIATKDRTIIGEKLFQGPFDFSRTDLQEKSSTRSLPAYLQDTRLHFLITPLTAIIISDGQEYSFDQLIISHGLNSWSFNALTREISDQ